MAFTLGSVFKLFFVFLAIISSNLNVSLGLKTFDISGLLNTKVWPRKICCRYWVFGTRVVACHIFYPNTQFWPNILFSLFFQPVSTWFPLSLLIFFLILVNGESSPPPGDFLQMLKTFSSPFVQFSCGWAVWYLSIIQVQRISLLFWYKTSQCLVWQTTQSIQRDKYV